MIYEDCRCQWSLSRPLLGLILLHEDYFGQLKNQIISAQATEKQATLANCFNSLMDGIERNLSSKNKDRFTQNVSIFRRDIMECLKGPLNAGESSRHNLADVQSDMMG
uniref:Uncharacterized protein n=1 Tax=Romanomermis culicivorax TaxID=13658 RepID=A0A915KAD7_ROMCU